MRGACLVTKLGSLMRAAFAVAGPGVWADARPEHLSVVSLDDPTFVQRRGPGIARLAAWAHGSIEGRLVRGQFIRIRDQSIRNHRSP